MTALSDAKAHLAKAREFLDAAEVNLDLELFNAATSNAVTSGINSKDAVCLRLTGRTNKSDNHTDAVKELKAAGPAGSKMATTFARLLKLKTKSQYQTAAIVRADAERAVEWAQRLLEQAETVVTGG